MDATSLMLKAQVTSNSPSHPRESVYQPVALLLLSLAQMDATSLTLKSQVTNSSPLHPHASA